ncbi:hypothetical protein QTO30_05955 [Yoonia sp. GPGPB17]|uniref:hypothetical protein n=1 Tax=Yoonia sp. GPGPB17 TaxID=3026147 RepID=UPI0030C23F91
MADIAKKTVQSGGPFSRIVGSVLAASKRLNKMLISQGAANARIRKAEVLRAKSDEDLAVMGLHRDDIIRAVFRDTLDV